VGSDAITHKGKMYDFEIALTFIIEKQPLSRSPRSMSSVLSICHFRIIFQHIDPTDRSPTGGERATVLSLYSAAQADTL
jgi:hypothetical protein